jgi:Fe(3+) dicitrate transport protein
MRIISLLLFRISLNKRNMLCRFVLSFVAIVIVSNAVCQQLPLRPDTSYLKPLEIIASDNQAILFPTDTQGMVLLAGKKVEIIDVANQNISLVNNNARQVFARVAGIQVWENDGSGTQVNVGTRGLSPNRSWEFNVRQNGYDISADAFGYPEAYYNPPMEAVKRIEIIRGASSLQYGPQFGGLLQYELDEANGDHPFSFKTTQTIGSFGLFSSYNAAKFKRKNFALSGYYHYRQADGWRQNSSYAIHNGFLKMAYAYKRFSISAECSRMSYINQQAGGLSDTLFKTNPDTSLRARNWFNVPWLVPSMKVNYRIDSSSSLQLTAFGLHGERNSVGFTPAISIADTINTLTSNYNNRRVDRDVYTNFGTELRYRKNWKTGNKNHNFAAGIRYYQNHTQRQQDGKGSVGSDFDLAVEEGSVFKRDLDFYTSNTAFFAENIFHVGKRISISPGIRLEQIQQRAEGRFGITGTDTVLWQIEPKQRLFLLAGISAEYRFNSASEFYGGVSQNYRPVLFSDLTPPATTDTVNASLSDASGYTGEFGFRTRKSWLYFDANLFYVHYANRIGTLAIESNQGIRQFRTNIGESVAKGVEYLIEINPCKLIGKTDCPSFSASIFASGTFQDARYTNLPKTTVVEGMISSKNLEGNFVEYAPRYNFRTGLNLKWKMLAFSAQVSHSAEVFASADNTVEPSSNGNDGLIPAYTVADLNLSITPFEHFEVKAGVNNVGDVRYFTRRSGGYPGPGLLPADIRNFWLSVGYSF